MSKTLIQYVRMLAVAVALTAMTLAAAPGTADAETKLDGKADAALKDGGDGANQGDGGGGANQGGDGSDGGGTNQGGGADPDGTVDAALKGENDSEGTLGDNTLDSATNSQQDLNLGDPQLNGDTTSKTEAENPAVPVSGQAEADGNLVADSPIGATEGLCVAGAVNEQAGDCEGGNTENNSGTDLGDPAAGLEATTANSDTLVDENLNPNEPALDGAVDNRNDIDAPVVPASATVDLDSNTTVPGLVDQDLGSCTTLNAENCSDGDAAPGDGGNANGVDLGNAVAELDNTTANNDTTTDQQANDELLQSDGNTVTNTDVDAPTVPASATANLDGNATLGETIDQDAGICGTLNTENCGAAPAPGEDSNATGIGLGDTAGSNLGDTTANSDTISDQQVNDEPLQSDGNTVTNTDVDAPAVPASAAADLDGNSALGETTNQNVDVCGTLNAENCAGDATPVPDDATGIDPGDTIVGLDDTAANSDTLIDENLNPEDPALEGNIGNRNDVDAPIVPASATANLDGNANVPALVDQDLSNCTTLNAENCAGDADPAPGDDGKGIALGDTVADLGETTTNNDTTIDQQLNDEPLQSDGNTVSNTDVDAPAIPASAEADLDGNAILGEMIDQDVGLCATLNAENCGGDATPAPDSSAGIDLGDAVGSLDDTTVDSEMVSDQQVNDDPLQSSGNTISNTDVDTPAIPASGTVKIDGNGVVGDTLNQDASSCTTLNAENCGSDAAPAPAGDDAGTSPTGDDAGTSPAADNATAPDSDASGDDNNASSGDNADTGSGSDSGDELAFAAPADSTGSSDSDSGNSGSGSSDDNGSADDNGNPARGLAFAAPADSGSGSDNSGSDNGGDKLAFSAPASKQASAAGPSDANRGAPLATSPFGGTSVSLATGPTGVRDLALVAGPSDDRGLASASSGSATKGDRLPDTGGISPLVLIAALLFIGSGIVLVMRRRLSS